MNLYSDTFHRQINFYCEAFEQRIFPAFDSIDLESEEIAEKKYRELGKMPYDGMTDMSDIAEYAFEASIEHFESLRGVRQSVISISLAGLYHLFEQQLYFFFRKQVLNPSEEDDQSLLKIGNIEMRLKESGIELNAFPTYCLINELRLIANVVKHGEGLSSMNLKSIRPKLFSPQDGLEEWPFYSSPSHVYLPLAGQDIYPEASELVRYQDAINAFWDDLLREYFPS